MSTSASKLGSNTRPLLVLAAIVVAVFALDRAGSWILAEVLRHSGNRIGQVYAGKAKADILILGNSVADAMVTAPQLSRATGQSSYAMAVHGLDGPTQLIMVKDYLKRHPAPRVAIMEVRAAVEDKPIVTDFAMFAHDSPELLEWAEQVDDSVIPWRRIFTLYNFNSRNLPSALARVIIGDDQHESASNGKITEARKRRFVQRGVVKRVVPEALTAYVDTIELLNAHGTKVIAVAAPMHPVTQELGDWAQVYTDTIRSAVPAGTTFVDALDAMPEDRYFDDPIHMNAKGRAAFLPTLKAAVAAAQGSPPSGAAAKAP